MKLWILISFQIKTTILSHETESCLVIFFLPIWTINSSFIPFCYFPVGCDLLRFFPIIMFHGSLKAFSRDKSAPRRSLVVITNAWDAYAISYMFQNFHLNWFCCERKCALKCPLPFFFVWIFECLFVRRYSWLTLNSARQNINNFVFTMLAWKC